ncbi:hypothetical protein DID88_001343 [Monilinia fructigena]|uniref:Uncharacterized protein n=1 Tax=Monilinia fructigena TaxID=38457 RepID=A0A395IY77_9HELO|nr:hypothetical protein DID88_001343 [Monilinia fructigena]
MPSISTILYRQPARLRSSVLMNQCRQSASIRAFSSTSFRASAQGYGDGKGNPLAENPQDQGASNAKKHNIEHPGPEPVSEGQGTGAGPTKGGSGGSKSPEDASAQSGGSRSKEAKETGSSPTGWFSQGERRRDMTELYKEVEEKNATANTYSSSSSSSSSSSGGGGLLSSNTPFPIDNHVDLDLLAIVLTRAFEKA